MQITCASIGLEPFLWSALNPASLFDMGTCGRKKRDRRHRVGAGASACRASRIDECARKRVATSPIRLILCGVLVQSGLPCATFWANRRQSCRRRRRRWTTTRTGPCPWGRRCQPPCRHRALSRDAICSL
ncbi:unnamed protein product [Leptosia nina]|uniref:Uncharacterized protein n=1 Tax=Leptosia nina TaxID=320188 RepID=A0AAV1IZW9_9NEOP